MSKLLTPREVDKVFHLDQGCCLEAIEHDWIASEVCLSSESTEVYKVKLEDAQNRWEGDRL